MEAATEGNGRRAILARAAPVALFVLLALVLFAPSVVGGKVLSSNDLLLGSPPFPRPADYEVSNFVLQDPPNVFYPGWRAEVDGHSAKIRPAMAAFRAVKVSPGRHRVRFTYRPASVYAGGAISLLALLTLGAVVVLTRLRRRG
jgi:hypothetical protein